MRKLRTIATVFIMLSIGTAASFAAVTGEQLWVKRYAGPANDASAQYIAADDQGNAYVLGIYDTGNGADYDYVTIKYGPSGMVKWIRTFDAGPKDIYPSGIAVDKNGNCYIAGTTYNATSKYDFALVKYDTSGNVIWVRRYNSGIGESDDHISSLAIDPSGNIYVTGSSSNKFWGSDIVTIKYSPSGTRKWLKRNGTSQDYNEDYPVAIGVDDNGNAIITGSTTNDAVYSDFLTIKYDTNGNLKWARTYGTAGWGSDSVRALAVDKDGNTYITGECDGIYYDLVTIKYNSTGTRKWINRYKFTNSNAIPYAIAVDQNGNAFVTGTTDGETKNMIIVKYDSAGNRAWVKNSGSNYGEDIAVSSKGNIYVAGTSYVNDANSFDITLTKYDQAGNRRWLRRYNSPKSRSDFGRSIAIGKDDQIFVAGESEININFDNVMTTLKYQP